MATRSPGQENTSRGRDAVKVFRLMGRYQWGIWPNEPLSYLVIHVVSYLGSRQAQPVSASKGNKGHSIDLHSERE